MRLPAFVEFGTRPPQRQPRNATALDLLLVATLQMSLKVVVGEFRNRYREFESIPLRQRVSGLRPSPGKWQIARVQRRFARPIGTGERSNGAPLRVTSILSLGASNSVPMPAVLERNVRQKPPTSDATGTASSAFRPLPVSISAFQFQSFFRIAQRCLTL
jgi:hypothetical protein